MSKISDLLKRLEGTEDGKIIINVLKLKDDKINLLENKLNTYTRRLIHYEKIKDIYDFYKLNNNSKKNTNSAIEESIYLFSELAELQEKYYALLEKGK